MSNKTLALVFFLKAIFIFLIMPYLPAEAQAPEKPLENLEATPTVQFAIPTEPLDAEKTLSDDETSSEIIIRSNHPSVLKWVENNLKKTWLKVAKFMKKRWQVVFGLRSQNSRPGQEQIIATEFFTVKYNLLAGKTSTGIPNISGVAAISSSPEKSFPLVLGQIIWTEECGWALIADSGPGNKKGEIELVGPCGKTHNGKRIRVYFLKEAR